MKKIKPVTTMKTRGPPAGSKQSASMSAPKDVSVKYGRPLADGVGEGKIWLITAPLAKRALRRKIYPRHHAREEGKIRHAIQLLSFVIDSAIQQVTMRAGETHAEIFVALKEILHDPTVLEHIVTTIKTKNVTAFAAVQEAFEHLQSELSKSTLFQIGEIAKDLIELEQGLLDALINPLSLFQEKESAGEEGRRGRIIVCKYLTPRLVLESRGRLVKGIVAEHGGENSHAAILCRALGIPAVSNVKGVCDDRFDNAAIALNGATGEVAFSLTKDNVLRYVHTEVDSAWHSLSVSSPERLHIMANVNLSEHAWQALVSGARGIGLYRTELEFLAAGRFLTEEEQVVKYRSLVMTMMGLPVVIRLLDVSRDKILPILHTIEHEVDTTLRGADFLQAHPHILIQQARAIGRVGDLGTVKILYPMIRNIEQFKELKKIVSEAVKEAGASFLEHGVMFEMPSACDDADEIFKEADFGSLGTNDLLKDLFGFNRETSSAEVQRKAAGPLVWQYIAHVAKCAQKAHKPLTVCGEMAAHPRFIQKFIDLGINAISVDFTHVRRLNKLLAHPEHSSSGRKAS